MTRYNTMWKDASGCDQWWEQDGVSGSDFTVQLSSEGGVDQDESRWGEMVTFGCILKVGPMNLAVALLY